MKLDLKRHELLKILSEKRVKFEANQLVDNEPLGVSFDELTKRLKCNFF